MATTTKAAVDRYTTPIGITPTFRELIAMKIVGRAVRIAGKGPYCICTVLSSPYNLLPWSDEVGILQDPDSELAWEGR
jgi:hypothetical protein